MVLAVNLRQPNPHLAAARAAMRDDIAIYAGVALYLLVGAIFVIARSGVLFASLWTYVIAFTGIFGIALPHLLYGLAALRIRLKVGRRWQLAHRFMLRPERTGRFIAGTVLMLLALMPFQAMFSSIKSALPTNGQFPDDAAQANLDAVVHFGHEPWQYLMAVAGNPVALRIIELNYDMMWFVVCFGALYWVATSRRADALRTRYCFAFFLTWVVVGNIVAGTFLSAGPAFYGFVTGDARRFAPLTQFLRSTAGSLYSAADSQSYLWVLHLRGLAGFGSGISAFPSMHVALVAMNVCFAFEASRKLGLLALGYLVVIMLSSTYLGWHYGIDGYAAVLLSVLVYWALRNAWPYLAHLHIKAPLGETVGSTAAGT
jgi:hypothetical protein